MAYYNELTEDLQADIWVILSKKVRNSKEHRENAKDANMKLEDYIFETVDDWINTHNFDLSNSKWLEQAEEADI